MKLKVSLSCYVTNKHIVTTNYCGEANGSCTSHSSCQPFWKSSHVRDTIPSHILHM